MHKLRPLATPRSTRRGGVLVGVLCVALFCFVIPAFAGEAAYIPARDFCATLIAQINTAQRSITAYYYLFALYPNQRSSQTLHIADALGAAEKRGVRVEVVLDNGAYLNGDPVEAMQEDNRAAYEYLRALGVDVFFNDAASTLHAKAMVLDSQIVIVGSANLSEAALKNNIEASLLVRSRDVALSLLAELGKVPRKRLAACDSTAALVPDAFLTDTMLLGRMITKSDERAFDAYLLLCSEAHASPEKPVDLDYAGIARGLGIDSMQPDDYRRQINKTLDKLEKTYGLVRVTFHFGKNAEVGLNAMPGSATVAIPAAYWTYEWPRRLGFPAKVMEILSLRYSALSPIRPRWSVAALTLASRHGTSVYFVQTGTVALRRANLLDVEYSQLPKDPDSTRHPNIYTPLPFYDPVQLDGTWQELEKRFGKDMTGRGRACAALVYKDSDWRAVEEFINLEQKYGREKVDKAAAIIKQKDPDNPQRCVGYFIGIVKNLK